MNSRFIDTLMEKSVLPSFSSVGVRVRKRLFKWRALEDYDMSDRVVVLTGGTSGIGKAAAQLYASMGATLVIVGRNPDKTAQQVAQLQESTNNPSISCVLGDLAEQNDVRTVAKEIASRFDAVDVLAHNAGALFNHRQHAANGTDSSVELMVATPFLLTGLLLPQLGAGQQGKQPARRGPGRVLTMSSGGMYTEGLTVDKLEMDEANYHGAKQYARAKRAQVVLNELWAQRVDREDVVFHALHPGWVNTPGITEALPGFSRLLSPLGLLRSAREGADTMVWLSADDVAEQSSGAFWHDRATRSIDMTRSTRDADTRERRQQLWQWCESHTRWHF